MSQQIAFFPFGERPIDPAKRHAGMEITSNLSISFSAGVRVTDVVMFVPLPRIARWHCRHLGLDGFTAG